jgi:hypothetical protein
MSGCLDSDCGESHALLASAEVRTDFFEFRAVLPMVARPLRCACRSLSHSALLLHHLDYSAGAVEILEIVIVSHVFQLPPVKGSLCEVQQPSDFGIGGIGNVAIVIIDLKDQYRLVFSGEVLGGNLYGFL